jgi:protein phosphatase
MSVPDQIAIISDVHANIPALEAVLADIRKRGIDIIFNLGDLVGKGGNSDTAIDICRDACTVIVQGNWDEGASRQGDESRWGDFVRQQIGAKRISWLRGLPYKHDFWLSGMPVRLFHASAKGLNHRVYTRDPYPEHLAMFENTDLTGYENPAPQVVGYGDIHDAYMLALFPGHKTLFNAGSVGNSLDIPLATYTILSGVYEGRKHADFSLTCVRLEYDVDRAIQDAFDAGAPEVDELALELRTGIYRGAFRSQQKHDEESQ